MTIFIVQVVCGTRSIARVPEELTAENEVVMDVMSFVNHPQYNQSEGPIGGYDLAVYKVDDSPLQAPGVVSFSSGIWPACFPKDSYVADVPGVVSGWRDPTPNFYSYNDAEETANAYRLRNLELKQARMELMEQCKDPDWMGVANHQSTFYPQGVLCARDPSASSCFHFGNSGSALLLPFVGWPGGPRRYSWAGSLSMYRGCDQATPVNISGSIKEAFAGENPGIFTQASCYLPWLAKEYGMELSSELKKVAGTCSAAKGTRRKSRRKSCKTNLGTLCDFDRELQIQIAILDPFIIKMDKCKLIGLEG